MTSRTVGPAGDGAAPREVSLLDLGVQLLRYRRRVIGFGLAVGALMAVFALVRARTYSAHSAFTPQVRRSATMLTGLAAQLGVAVPGAEGSHSPQFFEAVLRTPDVLGSVITARYEFTSDGAPGQGSLYDFYRIKPGPEGARLAGAEARLLSQIGTSFNPKTGVVGLTVTTTSGPVSAQINRQLLEQLDRFNRSTRQSQASAERQFTEHRLAEVKDELRQAEDRLQAFLQANRGFRPSSELAFQEDRLRREVGLRQQVFAQLSQAYEQARIEEVRDTPVITVVELPRVPLLPNPRGLVVKVVLGTLLGWIVGALLVLALLVVRGSAIRQPATYHEFVSQRAAFLAELRRPWVFLRPPTAQ